MLRTVTRNWWALALRGVAAVLFGIVAFIWPGVTLAALVLLWGAYALVDGVSSIAYAFGAGTSFRWLLVIEGFAGIAASLVALIWPGLTALALLYLIAAWAIVTGIFEIVQAIELRKVIEDEWRLGLSGIGSVLFGALLLFMPGAGALAVLWLIASFATAFGVLLVALSFRLRALGQRLDAGSQGPAEALRHVSVAA